MDAVVLDNEKIANTQLTRLINNDGRLHVKAAFNDADDALKYCSENHVSFVFADIEMPRMDGLVFGRKLQADGRGAKLVYVTAYSQYTLEAYQNYAVGYLLKPVSQEKLTGLLNLFLKQVETRKIQAYCLGGTSVLCNGETVKFRTNKAKELFFYLLCQQGRAVSMGTIIENLWCGEETAFAKKQLHNNLYYLRRTLEPYGLSHNITYELGSYGLVQDGIELDYLTLVRMLAAHEETHVSKEVFWEVNMMDKGLCFEDCDYLWAAHLQSRLEIELQKFYRKQLNSPIISEQGGDMIKRVLQEACIYDDE